MELTVRKLSLCHLPQSFLTEINRNQIFTIGSGTVHRAKTSKVNTCHSSHTYRDLAVEMTGSTSRKVNNLTGTGSRGETVKPPTQRCGWARASRVSCTARLVASVRMDGESAIHCGLRACVRNGGDYIDPLGVGYAIIVL